MVRSLAAQVVWTVGLVDCYRLLTRLIKAVATNQPYPGMSQAGVAGN